MPDSITRVTHQSWGSRIGGSFKGLLVGPIFFIVGIWLLVWNEGNSIKEHRALDEGAKAVISVSTIETVDPANDGKLVHLFGLAQTDANVSDSLFGVTPTDALKLKRDVSMFQWVEEKHTQTKKNTGGSTTTKTTYTYKKDWRSQHISSSNFQDSDNHQNPTSMPYQAKTFVADPITLGAYILSEDIKNRMNWFTPLANDVISIANIPDESLRHSAKTYDSGFYFGEKPSSPAVGDTRVTFQVVPEQTMSIVARQTGNSFSPYTMSNGKSVLLVEKGPHSAEEMFQHAQQAVTAMAWVFRLFGFILIFLGLVMIAKPISVFADVVPCFGDLVEGGLECVAFLIASIISALVISLSWLAYRPLFALGLLVVPAGLGGYLLWQRRMRHQTGGMSYEMPSVNKDLSLEESTSMV